MKKSLLLFVAGTMAVSAYAQTPIKENIPFVGKITANWCPPCGGWGFKLYDDVLKQHGDDATGLSMYSSTRTDNNNEKFQNQAAYDLAGQITLTGYPSFSVNLVDLSAQNKVGSGIDTHGIHVDVDSFYAAFKAQNVVASVGMTYRINGNTVEVKTKTKFWEAANGTYKVAVYLVEDGATAGQVTPSGTVTKDHHNVLRTSMSATTWGEQIATGAVTKDAEFTKDFTFSLTSSINPAYADQPSTWDKTKLVPFAIIYKVNGSKHDYVNGSRHYEFPATIEGLNAVNNMAVYPNPAFGQASVSFDVPASGSVTINLVDNLGRTVYTSGSIQVNAGRTMHTISTSNLPAGVYNLSVVSENGVTTQRLSVAK